MDRVVQRKVPRRAAQRLQFESLLEARVIIEDWRIDYNMNRPHTAHGDLTPTEFATACTTNHQPQAASRLDYSAATQVLLTVAKEILKLNSHTLTPVRIYESSFWHPAPLSLDGRLNSAQIILPSSVGSTPHASATLSTIMSPLPPLSSGMGGDIGPGAA